MLQELGHSRPHRTETCEILWKTRTFNDTRATPFRPLDSSVDVWHCYYVYGQDNENSQCRSHWMFDGTSMLPKGQGLMVAGLKLHEAGRGPDNLDTQEEQLCIGHQILEDRTVKILEIIYIHQHILILVIFLP
ncbi:calmodulin-binding transcription activator 2-like isoform X1 [Eucalyptus grandis]|uniref:calmodulin-binding transcription activator 2-like isoform X1 n=1 Tax=Eucalyptus grandis TaxID=71139 RepID=UPI00192E7751|nr:calmodulin-binding transcription activator 2-like isoform X1 [Eucalyptus grandis]